MTLLNVLGELEVLLKNAPGRHDQRTHAGAHGGSGDLPEYNPDYLTESQVRDFVDRSKTSNGRWQLVQLRQGDIDHLRFLSAAWFEDKRKRKFKDAFDVVQEEIYVINRVLGIEGKWNNPLSSDEEFNLTRIVAL